MNFDHFLSLYDGVRYDPVIVGHIPNALAAKLGAARGRVLLSHDTLVKQRAHHPDLTVDDYRVLAPTLMMGEYRQDTPRTARILYCDTVYNSCYYRAAIKTPLDDPRRIYVVSFNRVRERQARQMLQHDFPIIKAHD